MGLPPDAQHMSEAGATYADRTTEPSWEDALQNAGTTCQNVGEPVSSPQPLAEQAKLQAGRSLHLYLSGKCKLNKHSILTMSWVAA